MKKSLLVAALFTLAMVGCQKPNEIELTDDDSALEIETVATPDVNRQLTPVDSAGILPKDEDKFAGLIYLSSIRTQFKNQGGQVTTNSIAYSRVVLEDRDSSVFEGTIRRGYRGMTLRGVSLNGDTMRPRLRVLANRFDGGVEYFREFPTVQPRQRLTWQIDSPLRLGGTFDVSVTAPEVLQIQSPVGGSIIPRNQDLELKWSGNGDMGIILSSGTIVGNRFVTKPIFSARVKKNDGRAKLSKKFLKALPSAPAYMFTFVLLNRDEKISLGRFNGKVLVQASTIFNSIVTLK